MGVVTFAEALAGHTRVLVDTVIFSYHLGLDARYAPLCDILLGRIEAGEVEGLTTTITMAELLTRAAQEGNREALRDYEIYLIHYPHLEIVPLDTTLAREVALVRAETGLRMPDAIQIAAARAYEADAIVGNDRAWRRIADPALLLPEDYLDEDL